MFMGVMYAGSQRFLALCQECIFVVKILEMSVFRIEEMVFIPLDVNYNAKNKNINPILQDLKSVMI